MKLVCVPGVNGLGMTFGVDLSYREICKNKKFDLIKFDKDNLEEQLKKIKKESFNFLKKDKCFFVGGDHSVSFPLFNSFFKVYKKEAKLLVFDAHPDLMKPMKEPTHEEWLRAVVEIGFNPENILIVGVRKNSKNVDKKEISFAKKNGIKIIYSDEVEIRKKEILEFISSGKLYFSLDIDVLDSSIISSTGYPEKEGLSEKQFFSLIKDVSNSKNFFAGDLVEVNFLKGDKNTNKRALNLSRKILKTLKI